MILLSEIECFEGEGFIRRAYSAVLCREADKEGLEHYKNLLESGRLRKFDIIVRLRLSPEGRKQKRNIHGFWLKACCSIIRQIPFLGKILFFPVDFFLSPVHIAHLSQQNAQLRKMLFEIETHTVGNLQAKLVVLESENKRLAHALNDTLDIIAALKRH